MDVKQAVSDYLVELLEPARKYFEKHDDILAEVEKTFEQKENSWHKGQLYFVLLVQINTKTIEESINICL